MALESSVFSIQLENMQHSEFGTDRTVIVYSSGRISGGAAASVRVAGQRVLADTSSCHRAAFSHPLLIIILVMLVISMILFIILIIKD